MQKLKVGQGALQHSAVLLSAAEDIRLSMALAACLTVAAEVVPPDVFSCSSYLRMPLSIDVLLVLTHCVMFQPVLCVLMVQY